MALTLILSSIVYAEPAGELKLNCPKSLTPANEGKIAELLIKQGVIDSNASQDKIEKAVTEYLRKKMTANVKMYGNTDKNELKRNIKELGDNDLSYDNLLHGRKFGKGVPGTEPINKAEPWDGEVDQAKLLILLAEFGYEGDAEAPAHNMIAEPSEINNADLWVEDFSTDHYQKMLFTEGGYDAKDKNGETMHLDSMVDYYLEQSGGSFRVGGDAYGWYNVDKPESYYGANDESGNDVNPRQLVKDVLDKAAEAGVDFTDYDLEDPYDLDGDGDYYEPDRIIDRLVIVHAGEDESGGGGAQGEDALWAHSWNLPGLYKIPGTEMYAYNYIMQGENGAIGVFCHEFGHDLGLPDEYDTLYSGNGDSVGFISIMSSGSWTGNPQGTKPTPLSPWAKMQLQGIYDGNWMPPENIEEVELDDITKAGLTFDLDEATSKGDNNQVIKVNLPQQRVDTILPHEGQYEWFSGKENNLNASMVTDTVYLPEANNIELNYYTWYYTETGYDYGYVEISNDGGENWDELKVMEGSSGGWINESFDLSEYAGEEVSIRFTYQTDGGYLEEGIYLDEIKVLADGTPVFEDYADSTDNWAEVEWQQYEGYYLGNHYYLIEWKNYNGTGAGLQYGYNWVDTANGVVEYYRIEPGLMIWYANEAYTDNWVGVHPGYGYLGVVDAHPQPIVVNGADIRTRLQNHDAAFSYERPEDKTLTLLGYNKVLNGHQAVPEFSDSHSYWNPKAPSAGLKLPTYGLKIKLVGQSEDMTTAEVVIYK